MFSGPTFDFQYFAVNISKPIPTLNPNYWPTCIPFESLEAYVNCTSSKNMFFLMKMAKQRAILLFFRIRCSKSVKPNSFIIFEQSIQNNVRAVTHYKPQQTVCESFRHTQLVLLGVPTVLLSISVDFCCPPKQQMPLLPHHLFLAVTTPF